MGVRKTHQQFINEMKVKHPNLEILNEYFNSSTRIKYYCKKCGLYWEAKASKLSLGRGCPRCAGNKKKAHEEYVKEVAKINPNIEVISEYVSTAQKVTFRCKKCGYEWITCPGSVLRGKGCYWCGKKSMGLKRRKGDDEFKQEIKRKNPEIEVIGTYINDRTKVLCRCLKCSNEWYAFPSGLQGGHGCPYCKSSKGERAVRMFLRGSNIKYISQYKFNDLTGLNGGLLSYDFYLPQYNILIEYQGKQHKMPIEYFGGQETFKIQKEHDKRKREYAFKHHIKLIEVWYYENANEKLAKSLNIETLTTTGG